MADSEHVAAGVDDDTAVPSPAVKGRATDDVSNEHMKTPVSYAA
ncbi:hypothetical protein [Candidatus Thiosymbion oneisti]|nr:hypothetical protein [Candidatus Thiosymbion oneisti]